MNLPIREWRISDKAALAKNLNNSSVTFRKFMK